MEIEGDLLEGQTKEKLVENLNVKPKTWFKRSLWVMI